MGMLELENAIIPATGEFVKRHVKLDTVNCGHCSHILDIVIKGCSRIHNSEYTCGHCGTCICKPCAKIMQQNGGKCSPLYLKHEFFRKFGRWPRADEALWERKLL